MYPYAPDGDPFIRDHWRALIFALVMFIALLKGVPMEVVIFLIVAATLIYLDRHYPVKR